MSHAHPGLVENSNTDSNGDLLTDVTMERPQAKPEVGQRHQHNVYAWLTGKINLDTDVEPGVGFFTPPLRTHIGFITAEKMHLQGTMTSVLERSRRNACRQSLLWKLQE